MAVSVSARNSAPVPVYFEVWIDEEGVLRCQRHTTLVVFGAEEL
jgi:hypothetical protein